MRTAWRALLAGCLAVSACAPQIERADPQARKILAERVARGWSERARLAALALIERDGAPDELHSARMAWNGRGPWKRTVVRDLPPPYADVAATEMGVLEQTAAYPASPELARALGPFGRTLSADPEAGTLTARADAEKVNFLRVNLADEMSRRRLSAEEARSAHARLLALEAAGKTTGYLSGLRFARD